MFMEGVILSVYVFRCIEAWLVAMLIALGVAAVYYYGDANVKGSVIFGCSAFVVMVYYYIEEFIRSSQRERLLDYLVLDNPLQAYEAIKGLAVLCIGSGLVGHFDHMTLQHIVTAGAGVGYVAFNKQTGGKQ
jgi:hypothetical protein